VFTLGLALLVVRLGDPAMVAQPEPDDQEAPEAAEGRPSRAAKARRKPAGYPVPEEKLRTPAPPPSGNLYLYHVFRGEALKVNIYNSDGSYDIEALRAASHLLRCPRTDTERDMEPRLLVILSHIYDHFGRRRVEVTSGYRNQRRTSSYHFRGSATDILVPGVRPAKLRAFVETLDSGGLGIGLYPRAGFVHVDVRPPPSYRWIDNNPVDRNDPDRRPPRGWKKKRLQS
jgi:uncharacterized protein YcbK (DUF882 family)